MHSPLKWYVKEFTATKFTVMLTVLSCYVDCSFMLQIKGLLWYFTAFEKDDGVRLLIMKVHELFNHSSVPI
jgi:hypothetical protein